MPIFQSGSINNSALVVPDLYVEIVSPQNLILNGVPTGIVGIVGTASWGPINTPVVLSNMSDYSRNFGPVVPRKYDMGTPLAIAAQQGAQNFRAIRVTDGTDTKASSGPPNTTLVFTALYSGSFGNNIGISLQPGSAVGTWRLAIRAPGQQPELFDNISGDTTSFWASLAAAVNSGTGVPRGASAFVKLAVNGNTGTPVSFDIMLGTTQPGSDGVASITAQDLIGIDGSVRTGMYALRGQACSLGLLSDADDPASWPNQVAFGLDEGIYFIMSGPSGDTIENAISVKGQMGIDTYSGKVMFGDWLWWSDQGNHLIRLVSPQGFTAGRLANLSPETSGLNKPLYGIIGSQRSGQPRSGQQSGYSSAELASLLSSGIDLITTPQPGGNYWGIRGGRNSSSDITRRGDNYTRMTNYISQTLSKGMGIYVGQLITASLFQNIRSTLLSFLQNMLNQGILATTNGQVPFSVICDTSNNPQSRTSLGYVQADVQVQYQSTNDIFIVNLEGGQTVQVNRQTLPGGQIV